MSELAITESAVINAPPDRTYGIIADYHSGHPRIVPRQFHSFHVEKGGVGAGTIVTFQVSAFGRNRTLRAEISEPEPGRILLERYSETNTDTTFIVNPHPSGCEVTISTKMHVRSGISGKIERLMMERFLRKLYRKELGNLNRVACES